MDLAIILTYRCNSKCSMCNIWKYPTHKKEEVGLDVLSKIPSGIDYLNLTGGEPTLREDLSEIVDLLYPKAMQLEISSNGLHPEKLVPIVRKYPAMKIRVSLEGIGRRNDEIRGEKNGFDTKLRGLIEMKKAGGRDLGFATTIQDDNVDDVAELFSISKKHGLEMATSVLHNGFQFHKSDNLPYSRLRVARGIERLIVEELRTWSVKSWFRGYLNLGLIGKVLGHDRMLPCTAGTDFVFVDPWADMFACNVRHDLKVGNLRMQGWDEVMSGEQMRRARGHVAVCKQNCWMVGSAKTAMRHPKFAKLPRLRPLVWVVQNKLRAMLSLRIPFERYVDYGNVQKDGFVSKREYFLERTVKRVASSAQDEHYVTHGPFDNR